MVFTILFPLLRSREPPVGDENPIPTATHETHKAKRSANLIEENIQANAGSQIYKEKIFSYGSYGSARAYAM